MTDQPERCGAMYQGMVGGKLVTYRCTDPAGHDEESHVSGTVTWITVTVPPRVPTGEELT